MEGHAFSLFPLSTDHLLFLIIAFLLEYPVRASAEEIPGA